MKNFFWLIYKMYFFRACPYREIEREKIIQYIGKHNGMQQENGYELFKIVLNISFPFKLQNLQLPSYSEQV